MRRLNRVMEGRANYFQVGQVSPAYKAVDALAKRRLRQWLCRKHKVRPGGTCASRMSGCGMTTAAPPCSTNGTPSVGQGMISSESPVLEIGTPGSMSGERNVAVETEAPDSCESRR